MSDSRELRLVPIERSGVPREPDLDLVDAAKDACAATAALYGRVGFVPPWLGFLAVRAGEVVGVCGFAAPPRDGEVEIAYFTLPAFEGRGIATSMARALTEVARSADPALTVTAQTLPAPGASVRVLEKLGFTLRGTVAHPEEGEVWDWALEEVPDP